MPEPVEEIIRDLVRRRFLTRQKRSVAALHREIASACAARGFKAPTRNTVTRRTSMLSSVGAGRRREGAEVMRPLQSAGGDVDMPEEKGVASFSEGYQWAEAQDTVKNPAGIQCDAGYHRRFGKSCRCQSPREELLRVGGEHIDRDEEPRQAKDGQDRESELPPSQGAVRAVLR